MYGLRHAPHSEGGQTHENDYAEQLIVQESAALRRDGIRNKREVGVGKQRAEPLSPVHLRQIQQHKDRDDYADDHDYALYEVRDGGGEVAAEEEIRRGQTGENEYAPHGVDAERRLEDVPHALIDRGGIRQQEHEYRKCRDQLDILALVSLFEKLRHRARIERDGHVLGAVCEHEPCGERADEHIAYAYPHGGKPEIPAELARISHEYDGGEIGRSVCECREPPSHALVGEHEAFHARALAARDESDGENDRHIDAEDEPLRPDRSVCRR